MAFTTRNPYNSKLLNTYETQSDLDVETIIAKAHQTFIKFKNKKPDSRASKMQNVADILIKNKLKYAQQITLEMGKPISQSLAEVEKCAWVCKYYAQHSAALLKTKLIETESESYISYEPLGVILSIMPWNYPFWQVFRVIAPNIMLGNSVVIKHSPNTLGCGEMISEIISEAGFADFTYNHIIIEEQQTEAIIANPFVKGVTLTGSTKAGSSVAAMAGKHIKKSVLELGGNNALVVFDDADINHAVDTCIKARFQNNGQSCIAGKRLLVHHKIYQQFIDMLLANIEKLRIGNPQSNDTYISVLAREDLAHNLKNQLETSLDSGARLLFGGNQKGTYFQPTVIESNSLDLPVFKEETFGPLLAIHSFQSDEEAIQMINESEYGLGASIFTKNRERFNNMSWQIEDGAVVMNDMVKSHPLLPFGGTKRSGYGRELGKEGILEFANIKTIVIHST